MKYILYLLLASVALSASAQNAKEKVKLREILGATHAAGKYNLGNTTKDYLNQGADEVLAMGPQVIKLWFYKPKDDYRFNSPLWPSSFGSLKEMAQHSYYQAVFNKPFKTYILMAVSRGGSETNWRDGVSSSEAAAEQQAFYEVAKYLLETYRGTGKTFIFQPWELDWSVRGHTDINRDPSQTALDGCVAWLNARQAGVNQARAEVGMDGVRVFHAAEVNQVGISMYNDRPSVARDVLPRTLGLDLVSYSSWDMQGTGPVQFKAALDYIASKMPDSAYFGGKNVYVGEYGLPENDYPAWQVESTIKNVVDTGLKWGCPYIVYWQTYCNEAVRQPVDSNDDSHGFWLIRPDGTKAWAYNYFRQKLFNVKR